jgi:hypothetical protein
LSQRQCVCPCTLVRLGEIRQANIVRSLVDRQRSPPPPEARSIDRRPVFPLPSEQWPGRSMSSATLRRHQFSRSVRNISDNNCIYQLFGALFGTLPNQTLQHNPKDNIVMADPTYPSNEDPPRGGEQGARPVRVPVLSVVCEPCGLRERYDVESHWRVSLECLSHRLRACWKLSSSRAD